jgi:hypothetical protein
MEGSQDGFSLVQSINCIVIIFFCVLRFSLALCQATSFAGSTFGDLSGIIPRESWSDIESPASCTLNPDPTLRVVGEALNPRFFAEKL